MSCKLVLENDENIEILVQKKKRSNRLANKCDETDSLVKSSVACFQRDRSIAVLYTKIVKKLRIKNNSTLQLISLKASVCEGACMCYCMCVCVDREQREREKEKFIKGGFVLL